MSVIRWLVMQEVCLGLNLPAILNLIWPGQPPFYAHANTTTSDEHSIVTMLHSTRIIFSTYSFKQTCSNPTSRIDSQLMDCNAKNFRFNSEVLPSIVEGELL